MGEMQAMQDLRLDTHPESLYTCGAVTDPHILDIKPFRSRRTPILFEFDDARKVTTVDMVKLMEVGMNMLMIRTAFNSYHDKTKLISKCIKARQRCCDRFQVTNWPVAVCCSVSTCAIKSGILEGGVSEIHLEKGATVLLTNNIFFFDKSSPRVIYVDCDDMVHFFTPGRQVSFGDGSVILKTMKIVNSKCLKCEVYKGGSLTHLMNVSFKGQFSRRALLTKRDKKILEFVVQHEIDVVVIYYARNAPTVKQVKRHLNKRHRPQILGAICTQTGLGNIDELLVECDGIIFAREYLQWELSEEFDFRLFAIQKWVTAKCKRAGKPLFLSGGVLPKVLISGTISNMGISDIINALMDGVTGFMLVGGFNLDHAVTAIQYLNQLCCTAEPFTFHDNEFWELASQIKMPCNNAEAAVLATAVMLIQTRSRVLIVPTVSGRTIKALLWLRPSALIIAVSTDPKATRYLFTRRNVIPLLYVDPASTNWTKTINSRILFGLDFAVKRGFLLDGDTYITLHRSSDNASYCDKIQLCKVASEGRYKLKCPSDYTFLLKGDSQPPQEPPHAKKRKAKSKTDEDKHNKPDYEIIKQKSKGRITEGDDDSDKEENA